MEYSKDQILFLDILIKKSKSGIWMNLYQNSTDTQICLPLTHSHPNHWKQNISFCLAQRICTIADNNTEKLEFGKLKTKFIKMPLPTFTTKTRISEGLFNTNKRLTETVK